MAGTSFNQTSDVLFADMAVENSGTYPVDAPLLVGITNLSDPSVRVRGSDGTTPGGIPYFDYGSLVSGATFAPGAALRTKTAAALRPDGCEDAVRQ